MKLKRRIFWIPWNQRSWKVRNFYVLFIEVSIDQNRNFGDFANVHGNGCATLTWTPGDNDLGGAVICFTLLFFTNNPLFTRLFFTLHSVDEFPITELGVEILISAIAADFTTFSVQNTVCERIL